MRLALERRPLLLAQVPGAPAPEDPGVPLPPPGAPPGPIPAPGRAPVRIESSQVIRRQPGQEARTSVTTGQTRNDFDKSGRGEGRNLVVSSHEPDAKDLTVTEEDLNVMSRILEKATEKKGEGEEMRAMGVRVSSMGDGLKNLLIEDYGAIFMLRVDFPLSGPPQKMVDKQPKQTDQFHLGASEARIIRATRRRWELAGAKC